MKTLSVVVPCFNEENNLDQLRDALSEEISRIVDNFEVLLVDDGSRDGTLDVMRRIAKEDHRFKYLALSRNFGKESAMLAGLSEAKGDAVVILDADLQHPPELLAQMLPKLDEGYDQVVARRTRKGDGKVRSLLSVFYYKFINTLVDVKLQNGIGDFRVLSRRAVNALLTLGEYNRFSKGLFSWIGFDTAIIDYENVTRQNGKSSWSFRALFNYGIDGIISFNNKPLRAAIYLGVLFTMLAFGYIIWIIADALIRGNSVPGYVTLVTSVLGIGGLQLLFLGILGEYLGRVYYETKHRPHFLLKETSSDGSLEEIPVSEYKRQIYASPKAETLQRLNQE